MKRENLQLQYTLYNLDKQKHLSTVYTNIYQQYKIYTDSKQDELN